MPGHVASAIMVRIQKSVGPLALQSFPGNDFARPAEAGLAKLSAPSGLS